MRRVARTTILAAATMLVSSCSADTVGPGLAPVETGANIVAPIPFDVAQVGAGALHTCALDVRGYAWCWGYNYYGQVGNGRLAEFVVASPTPVVDEHRFIRLAVGSAFTCGLDESRSTWCWGANLGSTSTSAWDLPRPVQVFVPPFEELDAGSDHACGIESSGQMWCWGNNMHGEVGAPPPSDPFDLAEPTLVDGAVMRGVSAGVWLTCAIVVASGEARCWGWNGHGQLGDGTTVTSHTPVAVQGGRKFLKVSAGLDFACGLTNQRKVFCWGRNDFHQLGTGSTDPFIPYPVQVQLPEPSATVVAGNHEGCAIGVSGTPYCWGRNTQGAVGDGTTITREKPVAIAGGRVFSAITGGGGYFGSHTCGLAGPRVHCWGWNGNGQLGDGTTTDRLVP